MNTTDETGPGPLEGVRVLDLGHALAGPFAATMLGDFGAEVVKIERPNVGDPMRRLGPRKDDVPLWWKAAARNKKSVSLDFTQEKGRELLLGLVRVSDVLVENFRPGTLEKHGLGWNELRQCNDRLVMLRISGFGQTGPDRLRPGFGRTAEAMSGAAHLTGTKEGPPMHVGYSLADMLAGLMGAFGVLVALRGRERTGAGDCIDLALYEPLFRLIDWQVTVFNALGVVPMRAGNGFPEILEGVAAGVAESADGVWMSYSAATDSILARLVSLVFGCDVLESPEYGTAEARRAQTSRIEGAVSAWIGARPAAEVESRFAEHGAVVGRVLDIRDISEDPGYLERRNIIRLIDDECGEILMHGVVPKLTNMPGSVWGAGPRQGAHTGEVLARLLGVSDGELKRLDDEGVI